MTQEQGRWDRAFEDLRRRHREMETQHRDLAQSIAQLRRERAPYEGFFERIPVAYCTLDRSGIIGYINPAGRRLLGASGGSTARLDFASHLSKRQRALFQMQLAGCFERGDLIDLELTLRREGLPPAVVQFRGVPSAGEGGQIVGCAAAFNDITQRKRTESDLRFLARAGKQLASTLDRRRIAGIATRAALPRLGDCTILRFAGDDSGAIRPVVAHVDKRAEDRALRALTLALELGEEADRLAPSEPTIDHDVDAASSNPSVSARFPSLFRELGCRSYLAVPLRAGDAVVGTVFFLSCESLRRFTIHDLALAESFAERVAAALENARLFQEAHEAVRLRQDVLAIVSHDLRSPLHSMLLNVDMLLASVPHDERRAVGRRQIDIIRRSVLRMDRMIADLLDLSSIEAGHLSVQRDMNSLRGMLTDVAESFASGIAAKNIHISLELPPPEVTVPCDRERIIQVLTNLIGNAVKFTPAEGRVRLWCSAAPHEVRISIFNSGPGIQATRLSRVFDRYWQASETAQGGRGLGLFIAKGIVEAHDGSIRVQSEAGQGATFTVSLPLEPEENAAPPPLRRRSEEDARATYSVLIVEDELEQREAMAAVLAEEGHRVEVASDGVAALEHVGTQDPASVVLLDLNLPGMRGEVVFFELHRNPKWAGVPIVLVSSEPNVAATSALLGAAAYLRKPIRSDALVRTVERFASTAGKS